MKLGLYTDSIARRPLSDVLDVAAAAGIEAVELGTGGQSSAPHLDLEALLADRAARAGLLRELTSRGLELVALNCSAWPLHPIHGESARILIERTFALAELLEVRTVVTMSGTPGDDTDSTTFTWSWYPWPEDQVSLLDRQWESMLELWAGLARQAEQSGVRLAFELHPLHLVYNVPTLERLRAAIGPVIGANVDPSHLVWQRMDPAAVVRALGEAVHYAHVKDTRYVERNLALAGLLDSHPFANTADRAWTFCTPGRGGVVDWSAFVHSLRDVGYDGVLSIENEDPFVEETEGVLEAARFVRPLLAPAA